MELRTGEQIMLRLPRLECGKLRFILNKIILRILNQIVISTLLISEFLFYKLHASLTK
jgi:hypothetical protein